MNEPSSESTLQIASLDEAERAADTLAALILKRAIPFAQQHATVESLLATFADRQRRRPVLTYAAVLAAAGRLEEAQQRLTRQADAEPSLVNRDTRRAAWQLDRWIKSGGDPALIPDVAPPNRFSAGRSPRSYSQIKADSQAQRAALTEVKDAARGRSRQEARMMLTGALSHHGAPEQNPLWIESQLDHLWDTRSDQIAGAVKALKTTARVGRGLVKAFREHDLPDLSVPGWLEPPADALYEVPRSDNWTAAQLDPDAHSYLDRVFDACPHIFGLASFSVWLRGRGQATSLAAELDVIVGERPVGTLCTSDLPAVTQARTAAAARSEHLCLNARLSRHADAYLLEVEQPPTGQ